MKPSPSKRSRNSSRPEKSSTGRRSAAVRHVILLHEDGSAEDVYSDDVPMNSIGGAVEISRASNVEYNPRTKMWEARLAANGKLIARHSNRQIVIQMEIAYLQKLLEKGKSIP